MATKFPIRQMFIAAAIATGCSNPAAPPDSGQAQDLRPVTDLSGPTDTASTAPPGCPNPPNLTTRDGTCNLVPFPTIRVPFTTGAGSAPAFSGGTLVDGLYTAIKAEGWNTTTGYGRQMGLVLLDGGTTMLWFGQTLNADGSGDVDAGTSGLVWLRANYNIAVTSQNTLTLTSQCAAGTTTGPATLLYTATMTDPPQLILANPTASNPAGAVTTYERKGCPTAP